MKNLRWPLIVITAILALSVWGGFSYYHQRFLRETPLVEELAGMEEVEQAKIQREQGRTTLIINPSPGYRGSFQELYLRIEKVAMEGLNGPVQIVFKDHRNQRLDLFAREVSPALYEGARLGNYQAVAESIDLLGEKHQVTEMEFSVDFRRLYLWGRDGDYYLYVVVEVETPEGEGQDA